MKPTSFLALCFAAVLTVSVSADPPGKSTVIFKPLAPRSAPVLPGTRKKQTYRMSPWQTPKQSGVGAIHPAIQAKCGDDLHFFWNSEKHGLFLMPSGSCPELFIDAQPAGLMELMPVTTEGNVTVDLDEPGHFWFADPMYCGSHSMKVEVIVRCHNEAPRFSDYGLRSWEEPSTAQSQEASEQGDTAQSPTMSLSRAIPLPHPKPRNWDTEAFAQFQDPAHDVMIY
ncbi:hypothetical protein WJX74_011104 [Apatococcus lobatus]|uniref:Uncharacterized protein n=1 Tax=Apatococcus lobatus TaxID=904363 RepID=A0AAW1R227_9CHLO